jgi:hypothetical protein
MGNDVSMVVLNKKAFRLPRVEKEKFVLLLRQGLEFDRVQGTFRVANCNNIEKLIDTLSETLKDNSINFTQECTICGKDFPCKDCKYIEMCTTKNLPFSCVCPNCLREGNSSQEHQALQ